MSSARQQSRRIALFVEGDTERGDARRKTLPAFFHKWLDPQLPQGLRDFDQLEILITEQSLRVH